MSALAYRGREPSLLLEDSVFRVRQFVPTLAPGAAEALQTDPYAASVAAGIDAESEYAFCATGAQAFVWRSNSAHPTCYTFAIPPAPDGRVPHCILLHRPLNESAEPALLLANAQGEVRFWDLVSDALTAGPASAQQAATMQLPLAPGELVSTATRIDVRFSALTQPSQAVLATSAARLFRVHVYVHRGEHHLAHTLYTEHKGLLRRWLAASPSGASGGALTRLAVGPAPDDALHVHLYALSAHAMQVWRVPLAGAGAAPQPPRLVTDDDQLHKTIASRALYARGARYSAAAGAQLSLVDAAPVNDAHLAVLYADRSEPSRTAFGIALVAISADGGLMVCSVYSLMHRVADPRAAPRIAVSVSTPPVAFVAFDDALVTQLLADASSAVEETVRLKPGANRVLGASLVPGSPARWAAQTSSSGMLLVDMDVAHALHLAREQQASSPTMHEARVARLQERLEKAVWFNADDASPLQLNTLPDDLDTELLQSAVVRISAALVGGALEGVRPSVDLRTALAQRLACARRLIALVGENGYLMRLARTARFQLRTDAELLAGAHDLWRFFDDGVQSGTHLASVLPAAIQLVLGDTATGDPERYFFTHALTDTPALLQALLSHVATRTEQATEVVECARLVLALRFGAARFGAEHGAAYALEAVPAVMVEPWYAHAASVELLETLFRAVLHALLHNAPGVKIAELRTQLCALAEFAMDTYDARIAFLSAAAQDEAGDGAGAAREATCAAYDHARPALLHPLLDVGRADKAFALAEQHHDYKTLTALCFASGRETAAKRSKHAHPATHEPAEVRVEAYLDRYGMAFAHELYQYYVQHGAYRKLFEPQPEHAELVVAFLNAHPQYARMAWVQDILLARFDRASDVLRRCADAEREDIRAKQAMLSLGKLAQLATLTDLDTQLDDPVEQARLETFDDALDLVHVQKRLQEKWSDAVALGNLPPEAAAEHVAAAATPHLVHTPALRAVFVMLVTHLLSGHVASGEDMMDVLSLQDAAFAAPADATLSDFAIATQVYVRIDASPARKDAALASLWRRLYLQDEWRALSSTAHKTDQAVLEEVRETVAYATIQAVLANESTAPLLLSPEQVRRMPPPDVALLAERFPGLPHAQLEQLHAELAAEHTQLEELAAATNLDAFFAQVLAQPVLAEAPAAPADDTDTPFVPEADEEDRMDADTAQPWAQTVPGGAAFDAEDEEMASFL